MSSAGCPEPTATSRRASSPRSSRRRAELRCASLPPTCRTAIRSAPRSSPTSSPGMKRLEAWTRAALAERGAARRSPATTTSSPSRSTRRTPRRGPATRCSSPKSRAAFRRLAALGLTDAVRAVDDRGGIYTFWDYQAGAWQKNNGIRIDICMLSPEAADRLVEVGIDRMCAPGKSHRTTCRSGWSFSDNSFRECGARLGPASCDSLHSHEDDPDRRWCRCSLSAAAIAGQAPIAPVAGPASWRHGETVCLQTPTGLRLARCEMVLNNTSWKFLPDACPQASPRRLPSYSALAMSSRRRTESRYPLR